MQNIIFQFEEPKDRHYPTIIHLPNGKRIQSITTLPFFFHEMEIYWKKMGFITDHSSVKIDQAFDSDTFKKLDLQLFECLCPQEIQHFFDGKTALRIILHFNIHTPGVIHLCRLPWELMRQPNAEKGLFLNENYVLMRTFGNENTPVRPQPEPFYGLAVVPNPEGTTKFKTEEVKNHLHSIYRGKNQLTILEKPTFEQFCKHLHNPNSPVHVLHFIGHGMKNGEGRWSFCFEDENAQSTPIPGAEIAIALAPQRKNLKLVMICSCNAARIGSLNDMNFFNGIASSMVLNGVSTVVGTQFGIGYQATYTLNKVLSEEIMNGQSIEKAMSRARVEIANIEPTEREWATPVIYSTKPENVSLFKRPWQQIFINDILDNQNLMKFAQEGETFHPFDHASLFEGGHQKSRTMINPNDWNDVILANFQKLQPSLDPRFPIGIDGNYRISTALALGYTLSESSGFTLHVQHRRETWKTDLETETCEIELDRDPISANGELAVILSVSQTIEVLSKKYLKEQQIPIGEIMTLEMVPDRQSIPSAQFALGLAKNISKSILRTMQKKGYTKTHLFLASPIAFAVYLGRFLNTVGPIQVYEYTDVPIKEYRPSVLLTSTQKE